MSEYSTSPDAISPTDEALQMLFDDDSLRARHHGIRVDWLSISPSDENFSLIHQPSKDGKATVVQLSKESFQGFNLPVIRHVPLSEKEQEILGLPPREQPYLVTYFIVDYDSERGKDAEIWKALVTDKDPHRARAYMNAIRSSVMPVVSGNEKQEIGIDHIQNGQTETSPQGIDDMLNAELLKSNKEIAIIVTHDVLGGYEGNRYYANYRDNGANFDSIYHLLANIRLDSFAAVIDMGCASTDFFPDERMPISDTPYVAAQNLVMFQNGRFNETNARSIVTVNGKTTVFDYSRIAQERRSKEDSLRQAPLPRRGLPLPPSSSE